MTRYYLIQATKLVKNQCRDFRIVVEDNQNLLPLTVVDTIFFDWDGKKSLKNQTGDYVYKHRLKKYAIIMDSITEISKQRFNRLKNKLEVRKTS